MRQKEAEGGRWEQAKNKPSEMLLKSAVMQVFIQINDLEMCPQLAFEFNVVTRVQHAGVSFPHKVSHRVEFSYQFIMRPVVVGKKKWVNEKKMSAGSEVLVAVEIFRSLPGSPSSAFLLLRALRAFSFVLHSHLFSLIN